MSKKRLKQKLGGMFLLVVTRVLRHMSYFVYHLLKKDAVIFICKIFFFFQYYDHGRIMKRNTIFVLLILLDAQWGKKGA